ncbi:hypothetical protein HK097_006440 [Rhizophlyctis rosea]|uniref:Uncharacterized protein n=1 Tax=Rhizophlyctis rosea TaxID=64517 RepID=A0AAD5SKN2_9FUNG|nr:hypothetical protein HK097_006440 [Rhizophlyctis rosea]
MYKGLIAVLSFAALTASAPSPLLLSREFKLTLQESLFTGATPTTAVNNLWTAIKGKGTPLGLTSSGTLTKDLERTIKFYDTAGSCLLKKAGFQFRTRAITYSTSTICTSQRESTLKYRHPDRYNSSNIDLTSSKADGCYDGEKFQQDITPPYTNVFSSSTSIQLSDSKNINTVADITDIYPDAILAYGWPSTTPLVQVSGLTIHEKRYKGSNTVGLPGSGDKQAKFTLSLWYTSSSSTTPFLAEVSFVVEDSDETWGKTSTRLTDEFWVGLQGLSSWIDPNPDTKSNIIYTYQSGFCT